MAKKVGIDKLAASIQKALKDYEVGVQETVNQAVPKVAKAAVKALKETSPRGTRKLTKRKHYADNWASTSEVGRLRTSAIVYNKDPTYRVSHLLEYGHALRTGGRVRPFVHIAPVEKMVIKDFTREVEKNL